MVTTSYHLLHVSGPRKGQSRPAVLGLVKTLVQGHQHGVQSKASQMHPPKLAGEPRACGITGHPGLLPFPLLGRAGTAQAQLPSGKNQCFYSKPGVWASWQCRFRQCSSQRPKHCPEAQRSQGGFIPGNSIYPETLGQDLAASTEKSPLPMRQASYVEQQGH